MFWLPCQKRLKKDYVLWKERYKCIQTDYVRTELFIIKKYVQTDRDTIRNANESVVRLNFSF